MAKTPTQIKLVRNQLDGFKPTIQEMPDGSGVVTLADEDAFIPEDMALPMTAQDADFDSNLAEYIDELELRKISMKLTEAIHEDHKSREDWYDTFQRGLKIMGITGSKSSEKVGEGPFEGASDVFATLITDAVVQFQSLAYKELMPETGPANVKVVGDITPQKTAQATRVKDYLNYQCTVEIPEFGDEYDRMLAYIGKAGSAFKKTFRNPVTNKTESPYVQAEYVVVPFGAQSLRKSPRVTHVMPMSQQTVDDYISVGYYRDVATAVSQLPADTEDVRETLAEQQGVNIRNTLNIDEDRVITETLVKLKIPGVNEGTDRAVPYRVSIDAGTGNVLAIYRAFREGDPNFEAEQNFSHYALVQSDGFYGYGFIHLLLQLNRASTSLLRQMIDAGTLATFQGGFKRKGVKMARAEEALKPGEFRDIDGGFSDRITDDIMQLNFAEPSNVLFSLLGFLTDTARRMTSNADLNVGQGNQEAPVGTTIALLERGMQVSSAIFKRLIRGQTAELRIMARIASDYATDKGYPYAIAGAEGNVMQADFDDRIDIIPISDPENFSQAQRIAKAQFSLQLAQQFPQMHDDRAVVEAMYEAAGIKQYRQFLPEPQEAQPLDPMSEAVNALMGTPLRAGLTQDHEAHIRAHTAALQNPELASNEPAMAALQAHIQEHVAMRYQVQMMQALGITQQQIEQAGAQLDQYAAQIAEASQQITGQAQANAEAMAAAQEPDTSLQIAQINAGVMQAETARKAKADQQKFILEMSKSDKDTQQKARELTAEIRMHREKLAQQDREAELSATADIIKLRQDQEKQNFDELTTTLEILQSMNEAEQQRDAKNTPQE